MIRTGDLMPTVFNDFLKPWNNWFDTNNGGSLWGNVLTVPAVNIVEHKDEFKISLAVPGMKKEDFKIDVEGDMLTISAETKEEKEEKEKKYTRKEYSYSSFSRSFTLPMGTRSDKIDARYEDGVLKLMIPKTEETKKLEAKHIAVR
ncbi:MAG TPA: Hsp20/alpha crystallin family protein [Ferruginibacter sp.]|nr:Hsp20/alpha crystallin family protein [Ferruginibacter sp.]